MLQYFYIAEHFYGFTLTFTKLSVLLFFRRVFPNKSIQTETLVVGTFIVVSNLMILVAFASQCVGLYLKLILEQMINIR